MEAIIIEKAQFEKLITGIEQMKDLINNSKVQEADFIDNDQFAQKMNVSKRTAQNWRDDGLISFSQIGGKIYYQLKDIQKFLELNYRPAFKGA